MEINPLQQLSAYLEGNQKPLVVVLGPTASGKTSFSIELAKGSDRECEVVNADSRQLYKYLNIGTAKITEEEMHGVPHHLIDVLNPNEEATAGWFQTEAQQKIEQIQQRGNVPLLVGGSMLYISTITDELSMPAPCADEELRKQLEEEYDADDGATLYARLKEMDPDGATRVHQNNKPRLVRAVEICTLSNDSLHDEFKREEDAKSDELLIFGMLWPRETIIERIEKRTEQMFENGWLEEVQGLLDKGYTASAPAMKSTGYKEIVQYIQEEEPETLEELQEQIFIKTRQYARRQMTWWKRDGRIEWVKG